ncbi:MAG: microcin-processing peptidase 2 [Ignavibacteria bacterium]|nr:microcin-processing peptidase 2 [Ignavibacteria bacterium]
MNIVTRRDFIKQCGIGAGAIMTSTLWFDRLIAGSELPADLSLIRQKFGLRIEDIKKVLSLALTKGGDFSEIFFEYRISESVTMEEDIIKSSSESITLGIGIRVLKGQQIGYGYTNDMTIEKINQAALTAAAIAKGNSKIIAADLTVLKPKLQVYDLINPAHSQKIDTKIDMIKEAYQTAKNFDNRIVKVSASIADENQYIAVANSEGLMTFDTRPQVRLSVAATAADKGIKNTGSHSAGGRVGMNFYKNVKSPTEIGRRAAEEAIILLSAKNAPAGEMQVVLKNEQSGVMIHEAVGHPLEADANWKKQSIMWDKMGQMVSNPIVTIYDDATIPNYRGSLNIDDEGTPTENVMLIEKGKLVGFMNDRLAANIMKTKPNGHGRRETYQDVPIPRMNNTVLAPGDSDPKEIIESVKNGFYAVSYQGGQVSNTGKFTFSVNLGYLIEDGKITTPLKNATLIGTNTLILKEISMIGNDMGFFLGTCGKDGQSVSVTCGTPTLKINKMTVGGVV